MELSALKERLTIRAQAFVSDPELVIEPYIDIATTEAIEIAGDLTIAPVLTDIAFYRFLLLVNKNGVVEEEQLEAYLQALKKISGRNASDEPLPDDGRTASNVRQRPNKYI